MLICAQYATGCGRLPGCLNSVMKTAPEVIVIKINATQILPVAMILLDIGAAVVCLCHKDYRRAVYWTAAAILNASVTF